MKVGEKRYTSPHETYRVGDRFPTGRVVSIEVTTRPDNTGEFILRTDLGAEHVTPFRIDLQAIKDA